MYFSFFQLFEFNVCRASSVGITGTAGIGVNFRRNGVGVGARAGVEAYGRRHRRRRGTRSARRRTRRRI